MATDKQIQYLSGVIDQNLKYTKDSDSYLSGVIDQNDKELKIAINSLTNIISTIAQKLQSITTTINDLKNCVISISGQLSQEKIDDALIAKLNIASNKLDTLDYISNDIIVSNQVSQENQNNIEDLANKAQQIDAQAKQDYEKISDKTEDSINELNELVSALDVKTTTSNSSEKVNSDIENNINNLTAKLNDL